jgi:fucose 4-O-acetylase-like acetyltransferase
MTINRLKANKCHHNTIIIIETRRIKYLDAIAGLLIVRMILGHMFQCCYLTGTNTYYWMNLLFSFFMPWFFYKSGMLFTPNNQTNYYNSISYCKNKARKILLPWLVFSVIGEIFRIIGLLLSRDYNWIHYLLSPIKSFLCFGALGGNLPLWFLTSLFVVYIVNYFITKWRWNILLITLGCIIAAAIFQKVGFKYPATISSSLIGLSFYGLGRILKEKQFRPFIVIPSTIICTAIIILNPSVVDVCSNTLIYGNYLVWYIYSITTIIIINNLFKLVKFYNFPLLQYVGRNSITYFAIHWPIRIILITIYSLIGISDNWSQFWIMLITFIIILPLLNNLLNLERLKFIIGK